MRNWEDKRGRDPTHPSPRSEWPSPGLVNECVRSAVSRCHTCAQCGNASKICRFGDLGKLSWLKQAKVEAARAESAIIDQSMNTFNFEIFTKYLGVNVPDWVMGSNRTCENFTNVFKNGNFLKV